MIVLAIGVRHPGRPSNPFSTPPAGPGDNGPVRPGEPSGFAFERDNHDDGSREPTRILEHQYLVVEHQYFDHKSQFGHYDDPVRPVQRNEHVQHNHHGSAQHDDHLGASDDDISGLEREPSTTG